MLKNDALIKALARAEPVFWRNPHWAPFAEAAADVGLNADDVNDAAARLQRFAPYLAEVFPETANAGGLIESPLYAVPQLQAALKTNGSLYVKADNELPVSGSVKARGGIYEVLCHAEDVARQHGLPPAKCSGNTAFRSVQPAIWVCLSASWRPNWAFRQPCICRPMPKRGKNNVCAHSAWK